MITAYFDGSCMPTNPGYTGGIGAIIFKNDKLLKKISMPIQDETLISNNVAEYEAANSVMEYLLDNNLKDESILIYGDSEIVINAINKKKPSKGICAENSLKALNLVKNFKSIIFKWIPRERNTEADKLSKNYASDSVSLEYASLQF